MKAYLHTIIDDIPDRSLPAVKPLLTYLADDYWKPVKEPASPEEISMINERAKEFPSNFVPFKK